MTTLSKEQVQEIRALAAEATPGPWLFLDDGFPRVEGHERGIAIVDQADSVARDVANARYLARLSPEIVIALLDALDEHERTDDRLRENLDEVCRERRTLTRERDEARAERDRLSAILEQSKGVAGDLIDGLTGTIDAGARATSLSTWELVCRPKIAAARSTLEARIAAGDRAVAALDASRGAGADLIGRFRSEVMGYCLPSCAQERDYLRAEVERLLAIVPDEGAESVFVGLSVMQWAEVCASLQHYVRCAATGLPASQGDAIAALQEIDRVMRGASDVAPPDDILGGGRL